MAEQPLRIVQITDTHLFSDTDHELLGVKTQASFQALIDLIKAQNPAPKFILLTGDLSQDGSETAYIRLADLLSQLKIPVFCIPGNHDDSNVMARVYPRGMFSLQKQVIHDPWQFILLDSHIHGKVAGNLDQAELDFMEDCLKEYPQHHSVLVFHHQPIPVGCLWLDRLGVKNSAELWEILKKYPQVETIIFGHVHQLHEGEKNNVKYYSTPSTCIQFKRNVEKFALEEIPPAYRIFDFFPNGEVKTSVHYVEHYVGRFDAHATGY